MELWKAIKDAELNFLGIRGKGFGAFLLAAIILSVIFYRPEVLMLGQSVIEYLADRGVATRADT